MSDLFSQSPRYAPINSGQSARPARPAPKAAILYRKSPVGLQTTQKSPQQSVYDYAIMSLDNPEAVSFEDQTSGFFSSLFKNVAEKLAIELIDNRSSLSRSLQVLRSHYIQTGRSDLAKNFPEDLRREAFVIHNAYETGRNNDTHVMRLGVLIGKLKHHIYAPVTQDIEESGRIRLADEFVQMIEQNFRQILQHTKKDVISGKIMNQAALSPPVTPKNNYSGKNLLI